MISRPSLLLLVATLAGVLVAFCLLAVDPWALWHRLDPLGYAAAQVREAHRFTVPTISDEGRLEWPLEAWREIARSAPAESVFRSLAVDPNPVARIYGVAGVALFDSLAARQFAIRGADESTLVPLLTGPCGEYVYRSVSELLDAARDPLVGRTLLVGDPTCRAMY
jgi:hypothetical protein